MDVKNLKDQVLRILLEEDPFKSMTPWTKIPETLYSFCAENIVERIVDELEAPRYAARIALADHFGVGRLDEDSVNNCCDKVEELV